MTPKQRWIEALRSGLYKQCFGFWYDGQGAFCAVGLAAEIERPFDATYSVSWASYFGVPEGTNNRVVRWNDVDRLSFSQIADKLEAL